MASSTEKNIGLILLAVVIFLSLGSLLPVVFMVLARTGALAEVHPWFLNFASLNTFHVFSKYILFILPILLLALWVLVMVWVYRDAERRGMSGILWALLVMVGCVIGFLIYLIVRNDVNQHGFAIETTKVCFQCEKTVPQNYPFCPYCGTQLSSVCPACNKAVAGDWLVCPYCQHGLKPIPTQA
ncbi:zinc ribbon domain-containing protein [candidate division KSB1 bacterium]|nr:zinc ribbon domain-containing protein [candidate division KSB1 bacterium]